ncbi:MAG: hypothetical protein KAY32_07550 [Candidatus Eisenbacteria sp.]|nr:hypothetical protein [Candidatus Eisenbacteria bacterium]
MHQTVLRRPQYDDLSAHSAASRRAGEGDSLRLRIEIRDGGPLLLVNKFPHGIPAALTIVDDADGEDRGRLLAAYFGTSDTTSPTFGTAGILGHGLRTTRTIFGTSNLEGVWRRLQAAGAEIALHTWSGGPDSAATIAEELPELTSEFSIRHWVDHAVGSNPEDLCFRGSYPTESNPFYILDLLEASPIEYVWVEMNLFFGFDAFRDRRELPHYCNALDDEGTPGHMWVYGRTGGVFFENYWQSFDQIISRETIGELAWRAGLAIIYTHTCVSNYMGNDVGFVTRQGAEWVIKDRADDRFRMIADAVAEDQLWVAPASTIFDRLLAFERLVLEEDASEQAGVKAWILRNPSGRAIQDLGIRVLDASAVWVDAAPVPIQDGSWVFVDELAPAGVVRLEVLEGSHEGSRLEKIEIHPNPIRENAAFSWASPGERCPLSIFDLAGREVWSAIARKAGCHRFHVTWHGRMMHGRRVPSGRYWVVVEAPEGRLRAPLIVIR